MRDEIYSEWRKPRKGVQIRPRKHGCGACLLAVIAVLTTAMSDLELEAVVQMPASLINIEAPRILKILDDSMDLQLMDDEEKQTCRGSAKSHPGIMYYLDGCDFPLRIAKDSFMYKTHKKKVPKQRALRAQILIDAYAGKFRGVEVDPAGLYSDQGMLNKSKWNDEAGKLTENDEYVAADLGYSSTYHINVMKPLGLKTLRLYPFCREWNKVFNGDRSLIERNFADLQQKFKILAVPWRRDKHLFPLALRVCLKLMNRFWDLPGNLPPGLKSKQNSLKK